MIGDKPCIIITVLVGGFLVEVKFDGKGIENDGIYTVLNEERCKRILEQMPVTGKVN
jgi:hypothetical protein